MSSTMNALSHPNRVASVGSSRSWQIGRREFLSRLGGGFGAVALAQLSALDAAAGATPAHFRPRARRVIQLFMNGGASQMDLFDYKPELERRHGGKFNPGDGRRVEAPTSEPGTILKSPFEFRRHGQCGRWVSSVMPHLAKCVDQLAFIISMRSRTNVHGPGSYLMNTGFLLPGFPCLGAWVSHALGRISDNVPAFIVLPDARGLPYNQKGNFSAGFLPVQHQGAVIDAGKAVPIENLSPPRSAGWMTAEAGDAGLELLRKMNARTAERMPFDPRLPARLEAYELAARMQLAAPEAFDLGRESDPTKALYGLDDPVTADFGRRCLLARRLVERGVRFVQVWSGQGGPKGNWDNHASIKSELPPMAAATDKPIAGLLRDLDSRGLLDDTLVLWNTEFGRMPFSQGGEGRDHNGGTFAGWMAGAGVRAGVCVGESDEWSWQGTDRSVTTYDFHATVLDLLGIDHTRLTVRHQGADRRLTDVHGEVIHDLLA
jgi:hypothetical protein